MSISHFGKTVKYTHVLEKRQGSFTQFGFQITHEKIERHGVGVLIGFRNLPRGKFTSWLNGEERGFLQGGVVKCALVVESPHRNPIRVPMDCYALTP